MLKYQIKANGKTDYRRLYFREMYVSPDMAFISGVTDISTGLLNNENVYVVNSYNGYSELSKVETTDVLRQGRISYKEVLTAKTAEYDILSADTNITSGVTAKYFEIVFHLLKMAKLLLKELNIGLILSMVFRR